MGQKNAKKVVIFDPFWARKHPKMAPFSDRFLTRRNPEIPGFADFRRQNFSARNRRATSG